MYQLKFIELSLKRYTKSKFYKEFKVCNDFWGYTTIRVRKNTKECVFKLVEPSNKKGNVCIDNNLHFS